MLRRFSCRRASLYGEFLKPRLAWHAGHFPHLVDVHGIPAQTRLNVLHKLLMASGKDGRLFEIRLVPDSEFGFAHGKGGIIEDSGVPQGKTSFIGSANDSARAWTKNYELVWEDEGAHRDGTARILGPPEILHQSGVSGAAEIPR